MPPNFTTAALGVVVAVGAGLLYRGDAFWCEARGIPLGTFWRDSAFSLAQLPDMNSRTVLVTGANSGLGFEVAKRCALANASVVLGCRNMSSCEQAARTIQTLLPLPHDERQFIRAVRVNLDDLQQVEETSAELMSTLESLDVLVNNAGVATQFPLTLTKDAIESTFQSNYVGHFALTRHLLPLLLRSSRHGRRSRVVSLTSGAHRGAPPEGVPLSLDQINHAAMGAYARYGMAKLANLLFARELGRRHPSILSNAVHPGVVATEMLRVGNFEAMLGKPLGALAWNFAQLRNQLFAYSPETAARSVLFLIGSDEVEAQSLTGRLVVPIAKLWPPRHPKAFEDDAGAALWDWTEGLIKKQQLQSKLN